MEKKFRYLVAVVIERQVEVDGHWCSAPTTPENPTETWALVSEHSSQEQAENVVTHIIKTNP